MHLNYVTANDEDCEKKATKLFCHRRSQDFIGTGDKAKLKFKNLINTIINFPVLCVIHIKY